MKPPPGSALIMVSAILVLGCGSASTPSPPTLSVVVTRQEESDGGHALGAGGGGSGGEALLVTVHASESGGLMFTPALVDIPVSQLVTLTLVNDGHIEHDLEVFGFPAESAEVMLGMEISDQMDDRHHDEGAVAAHTEPGTHAAVTFTATQPGEYDFYCTIPGHMEAGMAGKLIVRG